MSDAGTCGCGKSEGSCKTPTAIQNGKGDAPRNISEKFRNNYDSIRWESRRTPRAEGEKFVKVYA